MLLVRGARGESSRGGVTMSMGSASGGGVPVGTSEVAGAAFPKGCLAMRIRDQLGSVFSDEEFREEFGERGRPGISPGQLALLSVLQYAENLTDRQTAHAVRARIDVKFCWGWSSPTPASTSLC